MGKKTNFFIKWLVATGIGAIGALLLAPKTGRETRKQLIKLAKEISQKLRQEVGETRSRIEEIYGKYSQETILKYKELRDQLASKAAAIKAKGQEIDKDKYFKLVDEVVAEFRQDLSTSKNGFLKMAVYLKKDWEKIKKALT
jgi:gas vesicle protein